MVKIDGIPVYNAVIEGDDDGMVRISLVDAPAVMSDFQKFSRQDVEKRQKQLFSIKDEEKRLVYGVVMRADFPIYRRNSGGEYYLNFTADTIRTMAEKYLKENRQNNVNVMHEEHSDVDGVQMVQMFIKDAEKGIAPEGFDDIADGSLFAEYHITNDEVWEAVKDGTYKGFSLEGYFGLEENTDEDYSDIVDALEGKFSRLFKHISKQEFMGKFQKFMKKLMVACASMATDKGVLSWEGDEGLKVGDKVSILSNDEEGNEVTTEAKDGDYIAEGKKYVVADGVVADILDVEEGENQNFTAHKEKVQRMSASYDEKRAPIQSAITLLYEDDTFPYVFDAGDDYAIVSVWDEASSSEKLFRHDISWDEDGNAVAAEGVEVRQTYEPVNASKQKMDAEDDIADLRKRNEEQDKEIDELWKMVDALLKAAGMTRDDVDSDENNLSRMSSEIAKMRKDIDEIAKSPAAPAAHEEFGSDDGEVTFSSNAASILSAMRK